MSVEGREAKDMTAEGREGGEGRSCLVMRGEGRLSGEGRGDHFR